MAYGDFTLDTIEKQFGVKARTQQIFGKIKPGKPSKYLINDIKEAKTFPLRSEKAKS